MKKLILSLAASATFAALLAASSNAAPPGGGKGGGGGGGGKSFSPAPRVAVVPAKTAQFQKGGPAIKIAANIGPAIKINANLGLGSAKSAVRINFNPAPRYANYHQTHGSRFSHGTFYRGRNHFHWSCQRWDARYRCYCYWDPCCRAWYYWNQPMQCYYPVSYCPTGSYGGGEPLAQIPVYSGEPIAGPMATAYPTDESLPPIPAPMFR